MLASPNICAGGVRAPNPTAKPPASSCLPACSHQIPLPSSSSLSNPFWQGPSTTSFARGPAMPVSQSQLTFDSGKVSLKNVGSQERRVKKVLAVES